MPRYELRQGTSQKFWEIRIDLSDVCIRQGKIGEEGKEKRKEWPTLGDAQRHFNKLARTKMEQGYRLVTEGLASEYVPAARTAKPKAAPAKSTGKLPRMGAITLTAKLKKNIPVGKSRLGGHPDLPRSIAWPELRKLPSSVISGRTIDFFEENGRRLALPFLCQLNLAELKNNFAKKGMLYFFSSLFPDDLQGLQAVIFYDGKEPLVRRQQEIRAKEIGVDAPYPLPEYLLNVDAKDRADTRLFGAPVYHDSEDEEEAPATGPLAPREKVLLLQIAGVEFGSTFNHVCSDGSIFFTMTAGDLAKRDFRRVVSSMRYT
jgi:predicted DNA-binding WGR domain protein/uncharacterized protein YwqG